MADHGHGGGKPKGKPKHGASGGGHGESSSVSGLTLAVLGIIAVVLLVMFYSGAISGPSVPVDF